MASDRTPLVSAPARAVAAVRAPGADTAAFVIAMLALQAQWAIVYIYLVPQLLELHVPPTWASDAWLLSPLLQLFVSPLAGRLSDRLAGSYGRRRPFILGSTVLATALLLLIPFVPRLCADGPRWVTVTFLLVCNVLLDTSNSVNEEFQRALATDAAHQRYAAERADAATAPSSHFGSAVTKDRIMESPLEAGAAVVHRRSAAHVGEDGRDPERDERAATGGDTRGHTGSSSSSSSADDAEFEGEGSLKERDDDATSLHSAIAAACGVGSGMGYILGSVDFSQVFAWARVLGPATAQGLPSNGDQVVLSLASAILFVLGTAVLLVRVREAPHDAAGEGEEADHSLLGAWRILATGSLRFRVLCAQQAVAWMGIWPVWVLGTAFFGHDVYGGEAQATAGTPSAARYARGVRMGSLANGLMALVCVAASLAVPPLCTRFGQRRVYIAMQTLSGLALVALWVGVVSPPVAMALTSASGLAWAVNNSIPFSLLAADATMQECMALATTVLYLSQVVPQIVVSLAFGPIVEAFGGQFVASPVASGFLLLASAAMMRAVPEHA